MLGRAVDAAQEGGGGGRSSKHQGTARRRWAFASRAFRFISDAIGAGKEARRPPQRCSVRCKTKSKEQRSKPCWHKEESRKTGSRGRANGDGRRPAAHLAPRLCSSSPFYAPPKTHRRRRPKGQGRLTKETTWLTLYFFGFHLEKENPTGPPQIEKSQIEEEIFSSTYNS